MRLVVADTSPIFYLFSINEIDLVPKLFGKVFVRDMVYRELCHPHAPADLRGWVGNCPAWLEVTPVTPIEDAEFLALDDGERAAITLALSLSADVILMDERKGTMAALKKGFDVTGTLGVLSLAARHGWVNLADCFEKLKRTNFRYRQEIMDELLRETSDDQETR